jgi:hypothetical protein
MTYSMYIAMVMATSGDTGSSNQAPPDVNLQDKIEPIQERLRQLFEEFQSRPITPKAFFELEKQVRSLTQELGRVSLEWLVNRLEPQQTDALPQHVNFEAGPYTRLNEKTPETVATSFGKIRLWRTGYRPTNKTGDPTIFPLAQQLGIVHGATPALAELAARYLAETGSTQRQTLTRLKQEHSVNWGVKKLREVTGHFAVAMTEQRHEAQVEKILELLAQASVSKGRHLPVLSVGRDGITLGLRLKKSNSIFEVASTGTISVMDRRGQRLGTIYLAYTPESGQGTMSDELTRLVEEVLRRWEGPDPRLCYVTDAGDNETTYYEQVLRRMRHPRTNQRLDWIRVVDYYHASERIWKMANALFGKGPVSKSWARRMLKLLLKPGGVRRVLASAAALHARGRLSKTAEKEFRKAYNYLRDRTQYMRYAAYRRVGVPLGSGVTEAACKTIYTQRLKLSGMRWKKSGAQTILNLRVLLLSGVWMQAYERVLESFENVQVPSYDQINPQTAKKAA